MGAFEIQHVDRGRMIERVHAHNTLHYEGTNYILRRMFPVGGSFGTARTFKLGISGLRCLGASGTPTGSSQPDLTYSRTTSYSSLVSGYANDGGALGQTHLGMLGTARQSASFTVTPHGRSTEARVEFQEFHNKVTWAPSGTYLPGEFKPPDWKIPQWETVVGYPWQIPEKKPSTLPPSEKKQWNDMMSNNLYTAATFSVGIVYITSEESVPYPILLASARLSRCLVIQPSESLYVRYASLLRPFEITAEFAKRMIQRALVNDANAAPSNYRLALATNAADSFDEFTVIADVTEPDPNVSQGYVREPITAWSKSINTNTDVVWGTVAPLTNASPDTAWETVNHLVVLCDFPDLTDCVCWTAAINAPSGYALPFGDRFTFPNGIKLTLSDDLVI